MPLLRSIATPSGFITVLLLSVSTYLSAQVDGSAECHPFPSNPIYLEDQNPSVQVGDFNGDGIIDAAAYTQSGITVLLGRGDGTFRVAGTYPPSRTSASAGFTVGDFNHDGKLDIAVTNASAFLSVLLGNGDGTFQPPVQSAITSYTGFLGVGDFNGDGKLDLVGIPADQFGVSVVEILLGNGDGTFQSPVSYSVDINPTQASVGDFNGDGKLDLAVADAGILEDPGHTVSILLGNGDGTFQSQVEYQVGDQPFGITTADFNGDGALDLATANYLSGTVSVLFGKGDGTFGAGRTYSAGHPYAPYGIAAVQFQAGENPGLAVATLAGVFILVNKGSGAFLPAQGYSPGSGQVLAADLNGDGKSDLVLSAGAYDEGSGVAVLLGKGHGVFATSTASVAVPSASGLAVGDFNGDGVPDVVVGDLDGPYYLGVMTGLGHGRFAEPTSLYNLPGSITQMAVGDFDGDGKLDLAVVIEGPSEVQILLGNGDGTFTFGKTFAVFGQLPEFIAVADFNGDGKLDLGVTSRGDYDSYGAVSILLGNGDGTFQSAVGYGPDEGANELYGLAVADFNHDGNLDFAFADNNKSELRVFLGKGDGTFVAGPTEPVSALVSGLAAADFNGDGNLDLAVLTDTPNVEIFEGSGNGSFTMSGSFSSLYGYWLSAADLNGDGKPDVAVISGDNLVQVFLGRGNGAFGAGVTTYTGIDTGDRPLIVADLNGDGALDLAAPNYDSGTVSAFLNRCPAK